MNPQGSTALNSEFFTDLIAQINAIDLCADLQVVVNEAFASLSAVKAAIEAEIASLDPILALLTAPGANLGAIVTWIEGLITHVLTPYTIPIATYTAQLAQLASQIAAVIAAVEAAAARIVNCTITIPSI
jgi:hypothetical protein